MPYPVTNGVTTFLPPPEGYVVDFDNPQKQDAIEHYLVFAILGPIAFLFLVQRLYTKYFILGSWKIDDALIVIAWSVQIWSISIGGLCHHAWEMPIEVFEKHMLTAWDPFRFASENCADNAVVYIIIAVVNIISDLILFVIPIPMIAQLKMPLGQKIGVAIMFGIATITVATSIIRMIYLPALLGALDIPWVAAPANVWSIAEANLFIVCGSMPTLRKFFKRFAPKWFGSSPTPEEAVVVGSVSDQSSRFGLDKKKKKKHTEYSQFDTMELGNYPDTVSQETQVIAGKADEENLGNVLYNSSEEAILQQSKIAYTKSFEVSRSP
ncbi:hypothetical protein ACHAP4_003428 [Fusarium culmorum]